MLRPVKVIVTVVLALMCAPAVVITMLVAVGDETVPAAGYKTTLFGAKLVEKYPDGYVSVTPLPEARKPPADNVNEKMIVTSNLLVTRSES